MTEGCSSLRSCKAAGTLRDGHRGNGLRDERGENTGDIFNEILRETQVL